jgi:nucleotide-binding universal stress UspA family protein
MYSRILVAIDGSDTSNRALKEAIELAKSEHSTLRLFHIVDLSGAYMAVEAPYTLEYRQALEQAGQKLIADCSTTVREAGIEFQTASAVLEFPGQHIAEAIEQEAKRWPADLIVIGTHGRRGVSRLFLGSVAEGVARIASKPVLLIRGT